MRYISCALIFFFLVIITGEDYALPRFALRDGGGECIDCHVNPSGGNMRNRSGWSFGKNVLPMISPRDDFKMSNFIGDNIQFGLDFRGQALARLADKSEVDFQRMTGTIYTNVDLSERINVFARYDFIHSIWEAYGVAHILPNNSYIKGGTFQPNFGIRIDDHTAYTRGGDFGLLLTAASAGLIYDPQYTETGGEIGLYGGDFAFFPVSLGNPRTTPISRNSDLSWTANLKITPSISENAALFFGGSFASFRGQLPFAIYPAVKMFGGYLGLGIGDFTIMGEYDIANDLNFKDSASAAIMVEAAYPVIKGLEVVVRYDSFDPNSELDNDQLSRLIFGFEFFPFSFVEVRPQYRLQMEDADIDNDSVVIQFHFWY